MGLKADVACRILLSQPGEVRGPLKKKHLGGCDTFWDVFQRYLFRNTIHNLNLRTMWVMSCDKKVETAILTLQKWRYYQQLPSETQLEWDGIGSSKARGLKWLYWCTAPMLRVKWLHAMKCKFSQLAAAQKGQKGRCDWPFSWCCVSSQK